LGFLWLSRACAGTVRAGAPGGHRDVVRQFVVRPLRPIRNRVHRSIDHIRITEDAASAVEPRPPHLAVAIQPATRLPAGMCETQNGDHVGRGNAAASLSTAAASCLSSDIGC